jgi:DUF1680 family protein
MKQISWLHSAALIAAFVPTALAAQGGSFIEEVPFTQVHFADAFWAPRIETNRTVSIPSAFRQCERNGRFDNFAIAGGLKKGEQQGDFSFDDTDPYKIIEGASYSLAVKYDKQLDHYLDSVIGLIAAAQEKDGYLCTCVTNKCYRLSGWWGTHRWDRINSHELYNCGHLYEAAVAHFKATGKRTLLNVALKNADLVCKTFGPKEGQIHRPSGHPIVEMALCKLYRVTGEKKYLDEAKYFVEETGRCTDGHKPSMYSQDHKPILQQDEIVGHAVRAGYLFSGVADVAALTHDKAYQTALQRIWDNMAGCKLYITGGVGSRAQGEGFGPNYELNNQTAYCETCAAIANVYWNHRMFLYTGDAKYADVVERALYNGVISGVSLSGDKFFYDNPLESMGQHERAPWFGCACCPGNITRFMASVPLYTYATLGNSVYVNLYVQGHADIKTASGNITLKQTTEYPWEGKIDIEVDPQQVKKELTLRLRIPGWAQNAPVPTNLYSFTDKPKPYTLTINGEPVEANLDKGYAVVRRRWTKGDKVMLTLPMDVRRVEAMDSVVDDRGKLAIERGPVMFCLEGKDQPDGTIFNKYIPADAQFGSYYNPTLLNGVEVLTTTAREVLAGGKERDIPVRAIPYSTWCNRGSDQMAVWIPEAARFARADPEPTLASEAQSFTLQAAIQKDAPESAAHMEYAWGVNDQWEPRSSADTSKPYFYWWQREGCDVAMAYQFSHPTEVKGTDVYWLAFHHYDVEYKDPDHWSLFYEDGNQWKPVDNPSGYGVEENKYNHVDFSPVTTTGLKIVARLRDNCSGGIIEWKVN